MLAAVLMFAAAPFLVAQAPYEATMGLVQKIFYFHVPSAMVMFLSALVCGIASAHVPVQEEQAATAWRAPRRSSRSCSA